MPQTLCPGSHGRDGHTFGLKVLSQHIAELGVVVYEKYRVRAHCLFLTRYELATSQPGYLDLEPPA